MIVFRVDASSFIGMGHLVRMRHLASELKLENFEVLFITKPQTETNLYLAGFDKVFLVEEIKDEEEDAKATLSLMKGLSVEAVVLDSYLLGKAWERALKSAGYRVVAFDDLGDREHFCDYLIDPKWEGEATNERYKNLVPHFCKRLLGPEYAILHPLYRGAKKSETDTKRALFSLGGGGDLSLLVPLLEELACDERLEGWSFEAVSGPMATSKEALANLSLRRSNIKVLDAPENLVDAYSRASLFVGALGTSAYELCAMELASLTFSLNQNQITPIKRLEALGGYLHISLDEFLDTKRCANLIVTLTKNLHRLKLLRQNSLIKIDAEGARRIVKEIFGGSLGAKSDLTKEPAGKGEEVGGGVFVRKVVDSDINDYLDARNLPKNNQNMVIKKPIERVAHYTWWFNNKRSSYLFYKEHENLLFIWDELCSYKNKSYLIGGWFVANERVGFDVAAVALEWQLKNCAKLYGGATWIAVIKKTNSYVRLLNKFMGFEEIGLWSEDFEAAKSFFGADTDEFSFVRLSPENNRFLK